MVAIVADITVMNSVMRIMFGNSGTLVEGCGVVEEAEVLAGVGDVEGPEATAITESAVSV